jgi:hypothetical protein
VLESVIDEFNAAVPGLFEVDGRVAPGDELLIAYSGRNMLSEVNKGASWRAILRRVKHSNKPFTLARTTMRPSTDNPNDMCLAPSSTVLNFDDRKVPRCLLRHVLLHEFMHQLGFLHNLDPLVQTVTNAAESRECGVSHLTEHDIEMIRAIYQRS